MNIPILIESIVGLIIGICIIFGRMQISKLFLNFASKNSLNYTIVQQKMLFIILWIIGIVFICGATFQIAKLLLK